VAIIVGREPGGQELETTEGLVTLPKGWEYLGGTAIGKRGSLVTSARFGGGPVVFIVSVLNEQGKYETAVHEKCRGEKEVFEKMADLARSADLFIKGRVADFIKAIQG